MSAVIIDGKQFKIYLRAGYFDFPRKIDVGNYEIYFMRNSHQYITNIVDKNTKTVIAKRYREDGTVTGVEKLDLNGLNDEPFVSAKKFTVNGVQETYMPNNIDNYFATEIISKYGIDFIKYMTPTQKERYAERLGKYQICR